MEQQARDYTVIRVRRQDADKLYQLFPYLKNDSYRLEMLLQQHRAVSVPNLPHPPDAEAMPFILQAPLEQP